MFNLIHKVGRFFQNPVLKSKVIYMSATNFAKNISKLRKKNGLTQVQLAQKISVSDKAVSKWEMTKTADT